MSHITLSFLIGNESFVMDSKFDNGNGTLEQGSLSLTEEIDTIGESLPVNTCSFTVRTKKEIPRGARVDVRINNILYGRFYVSRSKRKSVDQVDVDGEDIIASLENLPFKGRLYQGTLFGSFLTSTLAANNIPYTCPDYIKQMPLYGGIKPGTIRSALQLACFSLGLVADTSRATGIVFKQVIADSPWVVEKDQIRSISLDEVDKIQTINSAYYRYTQSATVEELFRDTLPGAEILEFSDPVSITQIQGGSGTWTEYSAEVTPNSPGGLVTINGYKFNRNKRLINHSGQEAGGGIIRFESDVMTTGNYTHILDRVLEKYNRNVDVTAEINHQGNRVGDSLVIWTPIGFYVFGIITRITLRVSNSIVASLRLEGSKTLIADWTFLPEKYLDEEIATL